MCFLLKFSLSIGGNSQLRDGGPSVAHALAFCVSALFPTSIAEVNVCLSSYHGDTGTQFVKECNDLVLAGKLLPHTFNLLPAESMVEQNKKLQEEVEALRKELDEVRDGLVELQRQDSSPDQKVDQKADQTQRSHHQRLRAKKQREQIPSTPTSFD